MKKDIKIIGEVVSGHGVGRKIGFPTANIDVENLPEINTGVYLASIDVRSKIYFGMLYFGARTVHNESHYVIEINIFDFDENIYGEEVEITLYNKIREQMIFKSVKDVYQQLIIDKENCLKYIDKLPYSL